jgi:hypothetical protein
METPHVSCAVGTKFLNTIKKKTYTSASLTNDLLVFVYLQGNAEIVPKF